jgi:hypothetical protein
MYVYYYIFRQRSSLPLPVYICPYHTKINKSLVPEWPCIIEVSYIDPPTTGNPDVEKSRSHAPVTTRTCPLWTDISRRSSYFFVPVRCVPVSCFLCCCWVALQPQFRQFHRELFFVFVLVFSENSTGFDVYCITVRFVSRFLCCCWVPLQPQFRHFSVSYFPHFRCQCCVVVELHSSHSHFRVHLSSFALCSVAVLLSSLTPATVSPAISPTGWIVLWFFVFSFSCCRCPHQLQATVFRFF